MPEPTAGKFSVTCWPGDLAAAWGGEVQPGALGLTLSLGTVDVVIIEAPGPDGRNKFARWCRQLSYAAGRLASELDPDVAQQDDGMIVIHRMPGGQPFAVEIRPNATATASRSIEDRVTSIRIKERRRTPLTIVLPEEVADQVFGPPVADTAAECDSQE